MLWRIGKKESIKIEKTVLMVPKSSEGRRKPAEKKISSPAFESRTPAGSIIIYSTLVLIRL
jgi:hypothetical protein